MPTLLANPLQLPPREDHTISNALGDHKDSVSIGGRIFSDFRFADGIVFNVEEDKDAVGIVTSLNTTCARYKIEFGPDKSKVMTNNPNGFQRMIKIKEQERVSNISDQSSLIKGQNHIIILSRITQPTADLSRLKPIMRDKSMSIASKAKLIRSLILSILSTFFNICESWTLTAVKG